MKKSAGLLTKNKIWQEANEIAEFMYKRIDELPREEEWEAKRKFHMASSDLIFYIAQAVGNASPGTREYDWGTARKHLFALQTVYRFACKQGQLEMEPQMMVRIDKLIQQIDSEIEVAYKATQVESKKDLKQWQEKYKLWKEMNK